MVLSATEDETSESNLRLAQRSRPLTPVKPPTARSGAMRRTVNSRRTTPSPPPQFQALPSVREGNVKQSPLEHAARRETLAATTVQQVCEVGGWPASAST